MSDELKLRVAQALFDHDHGSLNDGPSWEDDEATRLHYLCAAEAALAAMAAQPELPEHVRRIRIPTETMEQEFQAHYRLGFEAGKKAAQPEADELLRDMGLDPERFRTECGGLNSAKVRAAIRHPESYAGLYLPREHDFGHSAKFGGEICFLCGAAKGTPRADRPCVARPAPQQAHAQPAAPAPIAWVFQHDETGRMEFCENDGINTPESFAKLNPMFTLCGPVYTTPPAKVQEGTTMLAAGTDEGIAND